MHLAVSSYVCLPRAGLARPTFPAFCSEAPRLLPLLHRSYDYFEPQGLTAEQQQLFKYIEDADLWRWQLPDSKAFTAGALARGRHWCMPAAWPWQPRQRRGLRVRQLLLTGTTRS